MTTTVDNDHERFVTLPDQITITPKDVKAGSAQTFRNETIGHRAPSAVEVKAATNFKSIQDAWKNQVQSLLDEWDDVRSQQIDELTSQIQDAVDSEDPDALASIDVDTLGDDILSSHMSDMANVSMEEARREAEAQGVRVGTVDTTDLLSRLTSQAGAIARIMGIGLSNTAATQGLQRYGVTTLTGSDVASGVADHLNALGSGYLQDMLGGALTQAQNAGRFAVMSQAPGTYYASELLDENTCDACEQEDGTDFESIGDAQDAYPTGGYAECAGGPRCRGTVVAVYDEAATPE